MAHVAPADWARVYPPGEDTALLLSAVAAAAEPLLAAAAGGAPPALALELGSGSGAVAVGLLRALAAAAAARPGGAFVAAGAGATLCLAADISPAASRVTRATAAANAVGGRLEAITVDLAGPMAARLAGAVDLLVFNPPCVPTAPGEAHDEGARGWAGGARGREVIDRALPLLPRLLARSGTAFLLLLRDNAPEEVADTLRGWGLTASVAASREAADGEHYVVLRVQWVQQ